MRQINFNEIIRYFKGLFFIVLGFILSLIPLLVYNNLDSKNIYFLIMLYILIILLVYVIFFKIIKVNLFFKLLLIGIIGLQSIKSIYFEFHENGKKSNQNIITKQKSIFKTEDQKHKYTYGTIEEKIIILKSLGLSKQQIYNKLKNNTDFRALIKTNDKQFNLIYDNPLETNEYDKEKYW